MLIYKKKQKKNFIFFKKISNPWILQLMDGSLDIFDETNLIFFLIL